MKRLIGLTFGFIFWIALSDAQTVKGRVKDTAGKAVPYATISLKQRTGEAIVGYTVSDSDGNFALKVPAGSIADSLKVQVQCIGYQDAVKNLSNFDTLLYFILSAGANQLKEVIIKSSRPVLVAHGDTLDYKVSQFASAHDRTIGEVIKKMPGISVAANGTISYNNKPISALYLGGDNLLDDKYGIATNSIPQLAVSQVQVIQNNQPVKVLQNKLMTDDVALNLTFKKGAKLHLMGLESLGVGLPGNYDVNLNAMMFKNNYKAINYLAGNNTGYDVQQDLASHNEGSGNRAPGPLLSLGAAGNPQLAQNRYLLDRSGVATVNNLVNLKNNVQLKVNTYYMHDTQKQDYSRQTTIFLPGDTIRYRETQRNRNVPDILHGQFTLNINRPDYYLNDALLIDQKNNSSSSQLRTDSSSLNQTFLDKALSFSNEFNLIKALKSNHIIQFYSQVSHSGGPESLLIGPGYNAAIFNHGVPYAQLVQNVNIPTWNTNNYFSFKIPANRITQSFKAGFSLQSQTLSSDLRVVQNNNSSALLSDSARNALDWTNKKLYAEAAYDLPGTILKANLTLPLTLQQINYSDHFLAVDKNLKRLYFNPQFRLKYQVGAENFLNLSYSYNNQTGNLENVYPGYILTDYRTLYANNANLGETQAQQAGGGFSYRRALTLFFWNIGALYSHMATNTITSSLISNNLQQGIVLPLRNSTDSWALNGSVSKYSFVLRTTFSGGIGWQSMRSVQLQNGVLLPFTTTSETYSLNSESKVTGTVTFSYKAALTHTASHSVVEASAFGVKQLVQRAAVNYDPIVVLQFKLSGEHYFTRQQGNPDLKYFFADASAKFRAVKWKTDFELSAVNFLNVKNYNALYLSANTLTASSYTLPGRIVMLKVFVNL
jgi:hypothetical protein